MTFQKKEQLHIHIVTQVAKWLYAYNKAILKEELENDKYIVEISKHRIQHYILNNVDNYEDFFNNRNSILNYADNVINYINSEEYLENRKKYWKKIYREKQGSKNVKSIKEANEEQAKIRADKNKANVLNVARKLKIDNQKVTNQKIYDVLLETSNKLSLTTIKKHLKAIRQDNTL